MPRPDHDPRLCARCCQDEGNERDEEGRLICSLCAARGAAKEQARKNARALKRKAEAQA
jgi:hypothetical protein